MTMNLVKKLMLAASLMLAHAGAPAEDIDLFAITSTASLEKPNVLIILDNTANWNQAFANEKSALVSLINSLPQDKFNVGLMLFAETGGSNTNVSGGYVRAGVRTLSPPYTTTLANLVDNLDQNFDKGSAALYGVTMAEAYRYFAGAQAYAGAGKVKRDYAGNVMPITGNNDNNNPKLAFSNAVYATPGNAFSSAASTTYNSPITEACQRNFIIFISNGPANDSASESSTAAGLLADAGGAAAAATVLPNPNAPQDNLADEWARYMANNDVKSGISGTQFVTTYTLDINPGTQNADVKHTALLRSMATQGKGSYFSVSSANGGTQIVEALLKIFSEIQSVDTAFASATLPVSVNTQGTYLNQVFIGMFRPDKEAEPRWYGNLKQYQFKADVDANGDIVSLQLADKANQPIINPNTGFISPCANSFWSTADTFWPSNYLGSCVGSNVRSNAPDGEIVEKGAAAQRLRTQLAALSSVADRAVKTCSTCGDGSVLENFSSSTASIGSLLVASAAEQTTLINWVRGANNDPTKEPATSPATIRSSVHGDVVHSRPLAIDYGGTTGVVVFYGSNDGMLRAINANKPDSAGNELWAFIAPEHYGKLKRLRDNTPVVDLPGVVAASKAPKDYFFDGPIGSYRSGSTVWIYPTMRRGGSHVYAFNVSNPAAPTLKWKRGPAQLSNVGQTWSEPKVVKVAGYPANSATKSPVVIMGGGYDPCEDQDAAPVTACTSPKGNRVFVIDANSGTVLQTLGTGTGDGDAILRSVAADITVVDSNADGYVDVAYAVDTGANVYRIDIGNNAPGSWTVERIASLGCDSGASCARKFLHAPEVVVLQGYNAVLVGSGNRERPLLSNAATNVDNAFFMIKDDRSAEPPVIGIDDLVAIDPSTGSTVEQQEALASPSNKGWYLGFGTGVCTQSAPNNCHDKEQVVTSAVVVAGVAYFSTHIPVATDTECGANLGLARGYSVSFLNATPASGSSTYSGFAGGGLAPSPVAGVVEVALTNSDGTPATNADGTPMTANVPFVIGGGGISGIDPTLVAVNPSGVRGRVYWYIQQ